VEQSSTTMISRGRAVCAWRLRIVSATLAASLKAGTITVTSEPVKKESTKLKTLAVLSR